MFVSKQLYWYVLKRKPESLVETFKNKVAVAVHCWYIKDAFASYASEGILEEIHQKLLSR